ncbi:hypothetical protein MY11210_004429, partial [Beauveria gryllotalpidicola]
MARPIQGFPVHQHTNALIASEFYTPRNAMPIRDATRSTSAYSVLSAWDDT